VTTAERDAYDARRWLAERDRAADALVLAAWLRSRGLSRGQGYQAAVALRRLPGVIYVPPLDGRPGVYWFAGLPEITDPHHRWTFEVPQQGGRISRCEAWNRCRRAGRRVGVPEHAWRKCHDGGMWRWRTASLDTIDRQSRYLAARGRP
jgi:hypothetical protein